MVVVAARKEMPPALGFEHSGENDEGLLPPHSSGRCAWIGLDVLI